MFSNLMIYVCSTMWHFFQWRPPSVSGYTQSFQRLPHPDFSENQDPIGPCRREIGGGGVEWLNRPWMGLSDLCIVVWKYRTIDGGSSIVVIWPVGNERMNPHPNQA